MTRLRALAVSLAAVVLAAVAVWTPTSADGEPLTLEIRVSPRTCTAGSLAVATWQISGGEQPYQLTIDGESVDADAESATVRCGSSLSDAPAWLSEVVRHLTVRAEVADAAGATMVAETTLAPALPLPPPSSITVNVWQGWADYRQAAGSVYVKAVERAGGEADAPPPGSQLYIIRWRETGERRWNYEAPGKGGEDRLRHRYSKAPLPGTAYALYRWDLGGLRAGAFYELQSSRVRDLAERETPDALRWSPLQTTISAGPPRDITAHVTRDSVTVSWRSNRASAQWSVSLAAHPQTLDEYSGSVWGLSVARKTVIDSTSHTVRFDDLLPSHGYTVQIQQESALLLPEASFDIRTEGTATNAEIGARQPRIVSAGVEDGALWIVWAPPDAAPGSRHRITAREYGIRDDGLLKAADAGVTRVGSTNFEPGTTYRVVVEALDGHGGRDERVIETPLGLPEDRDRRWPIAPRLRVEWVQEYGEYGGFRVSWDPIDEDEIAQVKWERDGYLMSKMGESPIMINVNQPGRYIFRARLRLAGGWSSWTGMVDAATKPPKPRGVRIEARADALQVEWEPGWPFTPIDGYRVYYDQHGKPEQVFMVRDGTSVAIPFEHSCKEYAEYEVRVAAFNDEFGEGPLWWSSITSKELCVPARISVDARGAACDAEEETSTVASWEIFRGVAPFKIIVRGHEPFHTSERRGWMKIYCRVEPADDAHVIPVVITDALGRTRWSEIELPAREVDDLDRAPHSAEIDELRAISVFRNEVRISWRCEPWVARWMNVWNLPSPTILLRWRNDESQKWTYVNGTGSARVVKINNGCHWTWDGLTPNTRYEFQLAAWLRPEELDAPEWLRWSPLESVTTLGDAEDVRISRGESGVVVRWKAQPNTWAYQVILRGEGESWWRYHLANGEDVEQTIFNGLPRDGVYDIEIITPPRVAGEQPSEPGYLVPFPPH